jgi:hypothetical protein
MPPDKPRVTPQPKSTPDKTVRTEKRTTPAKPEKKAVSKPKPAEPKKKQDGQNDPS